MEEEPKYGYREGTNIPRLRPYKPLEYEIFDWMAGDVPEDHPDHLKWQRHVQESCDELRAEWTESEEERRRTCVVEPLVMGELF